MFAGPRCHRTNATYPKKRILTKKCDPTAFMLAGEREMKKDRETETEEEEGREREPFTPPLGIFFAESGETL